MIPINDYQLISKKCPEAGFGVSFETVRKWHTQEEFDKFSEWMNGQTMGVSDDGVGMIYTHDYERWVCQGMKTEQNSNDWD